MIEGIYVPIFEQDGNSFFIALNDYTASNADDAHEIGWGTAFVEGIILGFKFSGETREIDMNNTPHLVAEIGSFPVAILSGPLFDEVK